MTHRNAVAVVALWTCSACGGEPATVYALDDMVGTWEVQSESVIDNSCPQDDAALGAPGWFLSVVEQGGEVQAVRCEDAALSDCSDVLRGAVTQGENALSWNGTVDAVVAGRDCTLRQRLSAMLLPRDDEARVFGDHETHVLGGQDCAAYEAELQQASGKVVPLEDCDRSWLARLRRVGP